MAKITKKTLENTFRQARGWGHEMWIENLTEYCGKLLIIDKGKKGSLHYHMNKKETMLVQSGVLGLRLIDPDTGKEYFDFSTRANSLAQAVRLTTVRPDTVARVARVTVTRLKSVHSSNWSKNKP